MTRLRLILGCVLLMLAATLVAGSAIASSTNVKPRDGQYAGNGKKVVIFFNAADRNASFATVRAALPGCDFNYNVLDSDKISGKGRFTLEASDSSSTVEVGGRFISPTKVRGLATVNTSVSGCESGFYTFEFVAERRRGIN